MRTVAPKTEDQQAMLSLHRMRSLLVKFRTMQVNQLRSMLYEFGATFRTGRAAGLGLAPWTKVLFSCAAQTV